ncbi:hypothetical protein FHETE_7580 [Fusarium heterosporum]|uniref:Uncharacterized protein n=1 Tax=Fusarium heterosporum TaxID=42747 RepID=A0A8H5WLN2_FUSHE|nr:hypothetical protein FHETE_7580 [Fusarium heterosporum]
MLTDKCYKAEEIKPLLGVLEVRLVTPDSRLKCGLVLLEISLESASSQSKRCRECLHEVEDTLNNVRNSDKKIRRRGRDARCETLLLTGK